MFLATSTVATSRKHEVIKLFFDRNVLAIMTSLSEAFNEFRPPQPLREKIRSLGAIREMIKLAKCHLTDGLQQVRTSSSSIHLFIYYTL